MFIYKITVKPLNQIYIGLDTKPEYKKSRWKSHCKDSETSKRKIHLAIAKYGINECVYEVIDSGFDSIGQLALAEIKYIKQYDSYHNGLNSTPGGDGLGKHDLSSMTDEEIKSIKMALGESFTEYNKKKWDGMTLEERREKTSHLHTDEIISARTETLKEFYKHNPEMALSKSIAIAKWQAENKDKMIEQNKRNGLIGAAKMSKAVTVEKEDGTVETFVSKSEFRRKTNILYATLVDNMKRVEYYKGYKIKND
jgi:hypothetical protein